MKRNLPITDLLPSSDALEAYRKARQALLDERGELEQRIAAIDAALKSQPQPHGSQSNGKHS